MKFKEFKHEPVQPDTYEASMALNQLLKIGKHAIKIHNMIDDRAEMEAWVAKKIDLAGDYVKKVHGYTQGEKAGLYDDGGMTESREQIGDYAREIKTGKIVRIVDYTDDDEGIYTISYGEDEGENDVTAKDLKFLDQTGRDQEEISKFGEDAGEGHMSKSTLYHTAKYAIELMQMIKPGDDLEGWVQSKLNKAADYLQGVYNYEEYQKLNPYREELDSNVLQRHAGIVQKHIDEILAKETSLDDVDTKPGMMRILAKRVNEVEKEMAKENRKQTDEAALDEGKIKDWAKSLAMAGVFVAGMAGVGTIQDAIDRSIPAVQAMETALEMAQDQGNDELAKMIKNDLSAVKVRLSSGKDLGFVKGMQDKYSKFVKTEGLAYESKLAIMLNQQLK